MIDGYHKWLGIPKDQRPPTHYQLLGIAPDEKDTEVIEAAAVRQVAFVRNFQTGPHAEQCSQILTELAEARLTLLNRAKRERYDASLANVKKTSVPPPQSASNHPGDELANLSSLWTNVRIEPTEPAPGVKRGAKGGERKGWSSLAIAMQCGITGFTLVAAYYLLERRPKTPQPPVAAARDVSASATGADKPTTSAEGSAAAETHRPTEVGKTDIGPKAALHEVVFNPPDAAFLATGSDVRVIGSAPGRRLIVIDDAGLKKPRSIQFSLEEYKPLSLDLVTQPGGRTRIHVELESLGSIQDSSHWGIDAKNLFPFPVSPLSQQATSDVEKVTPAPAELELRMSPPQVKLEFEGLEAESAESHDGVRRYRVPGADGVRTVRARATLEGYKDVERTLTPLPGERRNLSLLLVPIGSTEESTARLGSVTVLPPIPAPTWAVFTVHLDPVPRSVSSVASGLKSRSYRIERGVHLYQIPAPDGTSPIKLHYSAPGFKPLETSLTPQPGERQDLTFHLAPTGSTDESRVIIGRESPSPATVPSPALRPEVKIVDNELRRFEGSLTRIEAVAITADGKRALAAGADGRIRIYNPESGRIVRQIHAHKDAVLALAISPSGGQVISAGRDPVVRHWDIATGHSTGVIFPGCTAPVISVAVTPKGDNVCAGDAQGFRLWNIVGTPSARRFPLASETPVVALAVKPHNEGAYVARSDRIIECDFNGPTGCRQIGPVLSDTRLTALDVAPGGRLLILGCNDGMLRLWDAASGVEIRRFEKHDGRVNSALFSSDGSTIVSGGGTDDSTIRLWEVSTGFEIARFQGHTQAVTRVIFTPGDRQLLSGSLDRTVRLWDVPK